MLIHVAQRLEIKVTESHFIFQTAPVLDIDASLHDEIKKYSNETVPYVVIRGLVKPLGSPIASNYNKTVTGVVQR